MEHKKEFLLQESLNVILAKDQRSNQEQSQSNVKFVKDLVTKQGSLEGI